MKNIKLLLFLFIAASLSFTACEKDKEDDEENIPEIPKTLLLKKYTTDDEVYTFNYTGNKITSFEVLDISENTSINIDFEYDGEKLMNWIVTIDDIILGKMLFFDHNSYDLPLRAESYYNNEDGGLTLMSKYTYEFVSDLLSTVQATDEMESGDVMYMTVYSHGNGSKNVLKEQIFERNNGSLEHVYNIEYTYDDKNNPMDSVGLFNFLEYTLFDGLNVDHVNNYITKTMIMNDGSTNNDLSENRTFQYNASGYPRQCTTKDFNGNNETENKYEY